MNPTTNDPDIGLDARIKTALELRKGDWNSIAATAGVSHSWLSKFVRGDIPNPGYATLKRVELALAPPAGVDVVVTPEYVGEDRRGKA